ncbi:MAG TPA: phosphoribosylanthranilate isomerase [Hyphomicrobiaceae bacterium]|nr:phosphoribosylanthranilate isomerase [Hyphomicrobiaceae bacterium]
MTTKAKICGLKTEAALDAALDGGADYVGFVIFPPSPRHITPADARPLAARAKGRAQVVALVVDPGDDLLAEIDAALAPDIFQLHGDEPPERVAEIRTRFGRRVMKAIKVAAAGDVAEARRYEKSADLILFDAKPPPASTRPGGHGAVFDWQLLHGVTCSRPVMLSGGLTPDNVAEAIRATGVAMVDVSSGVESRPGEKDLALIRRFLQAAKGVKQD